MLGNGPYLGEVVMDAFLIIQVLHRRQDAIVRQLPADEFAEWELCCAAIRHLERVIADSGPATKVRLPARMRALIRGAT